MKTNGLASFSASCIGRANEKEPSHRVNHDSTRQTHVTGLHDRVPSKSLPPVAAGVGTKCSLIQARNEKGEGHAHTEVLVGLWSGGRGTDSVVEREFQRCESARQAISPDRFPATLRRQREVAWRVRERIPAPVQSRIIITYKRLRPATPNENLDRRSGPVRRGEQKKGSETFSSYQTTKQKRRA